MNNTSSRSRGLTLIEVLVALAIVAMALMTGLKVSGALVNNAQRQTDALLAQLCADNALLQLRLSQQMPNVGDSRVMCQQASHIFEVALSVRTTATWFTRVCVMSWVRIMPSKPRQLITARTAIKLIEINNSIRVKPAWVCAGRPCRCNINNAPRWR